MIYQEDYLRPEDILAIASKKGGSGGSNGRVIIEDGIDCEDDGEANVTITEAAASGVSDVQINGTSIVSDGVANIPAAGVGTLGVVKVHPDYGITLLGNTLITNYASETNVKAGSNGNKPIVPYMQHAAAFYGLAKVAGADEKDSTLAMGTYTEAAKSAIAQMLNAAESISGSTPTIVAKAGIQYICGEVSTLDFTPSASGICDVIFTSGSTPTVLTVTPPTGMTMKWANGFDPTSLEANTVYEINVMNGIYGVVGSWS